LYTSIILSGVVVQLDPDPVTGREMWLSHISNNANAAVSQLDRLADLDFIHLNSCGIRSPYLSEAVRYRESMSL
jgi:hypothetical protein